MAFTELEKKRLEKAVGSFVEKHRPPPHIRPELDLTFRINGQSVEIIEVRPRWKGEPGETMEHPVAKATYVKTQELWRVFLDARGPKVAWLPASTAGRKHREVPGASS